VVVQDDNGVDDVDSDKSFVVLESRGHGLWTEWFVDSC